MPQTNTAVAREALQVLDEISDRAWEAYPVSLLPYEKEEIRLAILDYARTEGHKLPALERQILLYRYGLLAYFIEDEDAALLNSLAIRNNADGLMQHKDKLKTINLPASLQKSGILDKSMNLNNQITNENGMLRNEIRGILEASESVR